MKAALLVLLAALPAAAQVEATSSVRVEVASAALRGYECRKRPFAMENTRTLGRWYRYMGGEMVTEGWDPRPIVAGVFSAALLTPLYILAVPSDLVAAPFRRTCTFTLSLEGKLSEWAGGSVAGTPLELQAANQLSDEIPNVQKPAFATFSAAAATDASGRYAIAIPGQVGRSPALAMRWKVKGQPSGELLLEKKGGTFVLSEPDPGFGVGARDMDPILLYPERATPSNPRP